MCDSVYRYDITVGPESIDLLGHVNNREYLRWMEEAATAHAASLGWSFENLKAIGRAWVAREHWIEYLMPAFEGERLELFTWVLHPPVASTSLTSSTSSSLINGISTL